MKRSARRVSTWQVPALLPRMWQLLLAIAIAMASLQCSYNNGRDSVTTQGSSQQQQVPPTALPEPPLGELGGGKSIVAIVDDSFSMNKSDPHKLRWEGAKLMLALASEDDNFAAIAFAGDGQVVCPLTHVGGRARREAIFERMATQTGLVLAEDTGRWTKRKRDRWRDYTNFGAAFEATAIELEKVPGDTQATLVILTDGDNNFPQTNATTVRHVFDEVVGTGIPLCGLALRKEGDSPLLRTLTVERGGPYFAVAHAEDLLDAYVQASQMLQDLVMLRDAKAGSVSLHPGTRDFLLIVLRGKENARIKSLKAGGKDVRLDEDPHLHHLITQRFEVVNVPDPARITNAPAWTWEISSKASIAHVAKRPAWEFHPVEPLGVLAFGTPVAIVAELTSSTAFPDAFKHTLRAECSVTPLGQAERSRVEMELHPFGKYKLGVFSTDQAKQLTFDQKGQWHIHLIMYIRDDVDQTWLLDRNWLVDIRPPPDCVVDYAVKGVLRLGATVAGCRVQTWEGALLAGECPKDVTVTLPETLVLRHSAEPRNTLEVNVRPRTLTYRSGAARAASTIHLQVRESAVSAAAGIYRGEIKAKALAEHGRVQLPSDPLPIEAELTREFCRFDTTAGFGDVILGEKNAIAEWSVENVSCLPLLVRITSGRLTSESGLTLPPECLQLSNTELKLDTATRGGVRFSLVSSRDFPLGRFRSRVKLDVYDAEGRNVLQSAAVDLNGVFRDR